MTNKKNLVSVILSCYNSEKTLPSAIDSILQQSYEHIELLIMNDGSSDGTKKILEGYKKENKNIKIYENNKNLGLTKSLNILIKNSNGDFIARQDADDISFDKRIEEQVKEMKKYNLDFCTTRAVRKNSKKTIPGISYFLPSKLVLIFKNPFIHGTLLFKRTSIEKIDYYDENFYYSQDYKLINDMLKNKYKYKKIKKILYELNMKDNISNNKKTEQEYYASCVRSRSLPDPNIRFN